jgi:large subunit ribosomal protein L10
MNKDRKIEQISFLKDLCKDAHSIVIFNYTGSTVKQLSTLRLMAKPRNVTVLVARNRLVKIAFQDTNFSGLDSALKGATMIAISHDSPSASAKLLKEFIKDNSHIEIKGLSIGDGLLSPDQISMVAKMPTRDEALVILARALMSPTQSIAVGLEGTVAKLARALKSRSEQLN